MGRFATTGLPRRGGGGRRPDPTRTGVLHLGAIPPPLARNFRHHGFGWTRRSPQPLRHEFSAPFASGSLLLALLASRIAGALSGRPTSGSCAGRLHSLSEQSSRRSLGT